MGTTRSGVWSGVALETDPAVREFEADPATYMGRKASTLRSGEFESVRARLSQESQPSLLVRLRTFLTRRGGDSEKDD